jgi:hypothetical protein
MNNACTYVTASAIMLGMTVRLAPQGLNYNNPVQVERSGTQRGVIPIAIGTPDLSRGALSLHSRKPVLRAKSRGGAYTPNCASGLHGVIKVQALRAYTKLYIAGKKKK